MAQFMKQHRSRLCLSSLVIFTVFGSAPIQAQDVVDPTKPPLSLSRITDGELLPAEPVLQSILIGPTRKLAIIDGETVRLNGKFGNQILVKINESSVVLKRGQQLQTLYLHPDVKKKASESSDRK